MWYKVRKHVENYIISSSELFSSRTNLHGFNELYTTNSYCGKVLWILALTFCLGLTSYQLTRAVNDYVNEPYRTVIEKIEEVELLYPYVKICYEHWMYWVDFKKALKLNFSKQEILYGLSYLSDIYSDEYFETVKIKENFLASMKLNNFTNLYQFYKAIATRPPNPFFRDISFKENMFCYGMNSSRMIKMFEKVPSLMSRKDKFKARFEIMDKKVEALNAGFMSQQEHTCYVAYYLLQNHTTFSKAEFRKETFLKNPVPKYPYELRTYLIVDTEQMEIRSDDLFLIIHAHATVSKWQNTPSFSCVPRKISVISNDRCNKTCQEKFFTDVCSCQWFGSVYRGGFDYDRYLCRKNISFFTSLDHCVNLVSANRREMSKNKISFNCLLNERADSCCVNATEKVKEFNECVKKCAPGCTIWNYYLGYVQRLKLGSFGNVVTKNSFTVDINFPTIHDILSTNEIHSQTMEHFVGNIGGLLGVWTGASVLSILQLIYLCCCNEFSWCGERKKRKETYKAIPMIEKDNECVIEIEITPNCVNNTE